MRAIGVFFVLSCAALGQTVSPILRGVLLECDPRTAGELSIRAADNEVFRYEFDAKTYVERDDRLIQAAQLKPGDKVEIVSDRAPGFTLRYARTIHVMQEVAPSHTARAALPRAYNPRNPYGAAIETVRTGTLSYSGVIYRINGEKFGLHTREAGDLNILLRNDTRYLEDGQVVGLVELKPNMRVFVSAGKDVYNNELEAYQVIWSTVRAK